MNNHININHLGQRNFVCPHEDCARAFGYKHLLQRHLAKIHVPQSDEDEPDDPDDPTGEDECNQEISTISHIDDITGVTYAIRTQEKLKNTKSLVCPYPNLHMFKDASDHDPAQPGPSKPCDYVFSRAYDLRRHLRTVHDFEADKDRVDEWVRKEKRNRASSS